MSQSKNHSFRILGQDPLDFIREILVLVLGILIAFWLNNWWTDRLHKLEEAEMIEALYKEFQTSMDALEFEQKRLEGQIAATQEILTMTTMPLETIPSVNADTLLGYLLSVPKFEPFFGVVQEMLNSGQLSVLSSDELRIQLSAWPTSLSEIRAVQSHWERRATNVIMPYLYSRVAFVNMDSRKSSYSPGTIRAHANIDNREVYNDLEFQNIVDDQLWNFDYLQKEYSDLENKMNYIMSLLREEIEKQNIQLHYPESN